MDNEHNVELIRRHVINEHAGDSEAVLAEMTDPPVYYIPGVGRYVEGADPIMAIHHGLNDMFELDLKMDIKEIAANDEIGFVTLEIGGTLRGDVNGVPAGTYAIFPSCATYKFKDGKISQESIWAEPVRPGLTENLQGKPPVIRDVNGAIMAITSIAADAPTTPVPDSAVI